MRSLYGIIPQLFDLFYEYMIAVKTQANNPLAQLRYQDSWL